MRKLLDRIIKKLGGCTQQEYQAGIDSIWQYHFVEKERWKNAVKRFDIVVDDKSDEDEYLSAIGKTVMTLGMLEFAEVESQGAKVTITIHIVDKKRL